MNNLAPISPESFSPFFQALWGCDPFPWQVEFAKRLCAGAPPDFVTVPTGSGKTACLDAALFALAVQAARPPAERTVGRRIFFIVNRRIIVDEAYERASRHLLPALRAPGKYLKEREGRKPGERRLSESKLAEATAILDQVAWWLRKVAGGDNAEPLACAELRGGIYRDRAWAKSLIQPMILCSTVDQAGSRLLFRGYGVSPEARPIHAALLAQDSLLFIDEAHISQPFVETLNWIKDYRTFQWPNGQIVALPFSLVCLTATPPSGKPEATTLELSDTDREHPVLKPRLTSVKMAQLAHAPKAKGKNWKAELAKALEAHASTIISNHAPRSIAIMVNRVATARAVYALIQKNQPTADVALLLGRMRPLDRDALTEKLGVVLKTTRPGFEAVAEHSLQIVVSTQCLEVGADFDFDALVTECASLDALRQRFGRLNRGGRPITAHAVIVLPEEQNIALDKLAAETPIDPIYGNSIPRTWHWLQGLPGGADFGLTSMTTAINALRASKDEDQLNAMLTPAIHAPALLPAYLDCWVQTNPPPAADPNVALFLHGPKRDMAEVQVCWRADLPEEASPAAWKEILALCPPTTIECLPVPLHFMNQWLENGANLAEVDSSGDAPQDTPEPEKHRRPSVQPSRAFIWRGGKARGGGADEASRFFEKPQDIRAGDTLILRTQDGGWQALGHLPNAPADPLAPDAANVDCAERGQACMRRRAFVRLHPALWPAGEKDTPTWQLFEWTKDPEFEWRSPEASEMLAAAAEQIGGVNNDPGSLSTRLRHLAKWTLRKRGQSGLETESCSGYGGLVLSVRELLPVSSETSDDTGSDDDADDPLLETAKPQSLDAHTRHVTAVAGAYTTALGLDAFADALIRSAGLHDLGKADPRFQALLIGSDVAAALAQPVLWAKSASVPTSALARQRAREKATLPDGFRHEMLSVKIGENALGSSALPSDNQFRALILHLIATHHGYARPFAPLIEDKTPPNVTLPMKDKTVTVTEAERREHPAHALDSGLPERFWQMNRRYGWWGIALLESLIRLADQYASAKGQSEEI
jgi:CRISPR-associated endonuclease/helicase Cas3